VQYPMLATYTVEMDVPFQTPNPLIVWEGLRELPQRAHFSPGEAAPGIGKHSSDPIPKLFIRHRTCVLTRLVPIRALALRTHLGLGIEVAATRYPLVVAPVAPVPHDGNWHPRHFRTSVTSPYLGIDYQGGQDEATLVIYT
jgi:hypothetical protein